MSGTPPSGPTTRPVHQLRIVPNPTATARAAARRTGGRHRRPDGDTPPAGIPVVGTRASGSHAVDSRSATTDVVPAQCVARLTVPPPGVRDAGASHWPPGA